MIERLIIMKIKNLIKSSRKNNTIVKSIIERRFGNGKFRNRKPPPSIF